MRILHLASRAAPPGKPLALFALLLLTASAIPLTVPAQTVYRVETTAFDDVLFTSVNLAVDAGLDPYTGNRWVSTLGGLLEIAADSSWRRLYTQRDGLVECGCSGLAVAEDAVWVGTDAGVARLDKATRNVTTYTADNSPFPGRVARTLALDGDVLWVGTHTGGVARLDTTSGAWSTYPITDATTRTRPVWDLLVTDDYVYAASENGGLQRLERGENESTNNFAPYATMDEGLLTNEVLSVEEDADGSFWLGTSQGLVRYDPDAPEAARVTLYTIADGLADNKVVHVALQARGEGRVWAATGKGVSVLDPETRTFTYHGVSDGILSNNVLRIHHFGEEDWYATDRGLTIADRANQKWHYFTTANGPGATAAIQGSAASGLVWWGTTNDLSAYDPAKGRWYGFGPLEGIENRPVRDVVSHGGFLWLATYGAIYKFDPEVGEVVGIFKDTRPPVDPKRQLNVFDHVGVDDEHLWMPEAGYGLLVYEFATGSSQFYGMNDGISLTLSDVQPVGNAAWIASRDGLYKFNKELRTLEGGWSYFTGDLPADILTNLVPDGKNLWVASEDGGVFRWSTELEKVTAAYNVSSGHLPHDAVRDVVRDGNLLWVATQAGLARVDLTTGESIVLTEEDGLLYDVTRGLVLHQGLLYVGTPIGVSVLDTQTLEFFPMQLGASEIPEVTPPGGGGEQVPTNRSFPATLTFEKPENGEAVTENLTLHGRATRPGGGIDAVEVSVDGGEWQPAIGVDPWRLTVDTAPLVTDEVRDVWIRARAVVEGEPQSEESLSILVVPPPTTPLTLQHTPPTVAYTGSPIVFTAFATGDPPLTVTAYYKRDGETLFAPVVLRHVAGSEYRGEFPVLRTPGNLTYFLDAQSNLLKERWPRGDEGATYTLFVQAPSGAPARLAAPTGPVSVKPGESATFTVALENQADTAKTYTLRAVGARSEWVSFLVDGQTEATFTLDPGASREAEVIVAAPATAYATSASVRLQAALTGEDTPTQPVAVEVPLTVLEAAVQGSSGTGGGFDTKPAPEDKGLPGPGALAALAAVGLATLALRRRRA